MRRCGASTRRTRGARTPCPGRGIVLEHGAGHSMPPAEMKDVLAWIDAVVAGQKTTLVTRRAGGDDTGAEGGKET